MLLYIILSESDFSLKYLRQTENISTFMHAILEPNTLKEHLFLNSVGNGRVLFKSTSATIILISFLRLLDFIPA